MIIKVCIVYIVKSKQSFFKNIDFFEKNKIRKINRQKENSFSKNNRI